MGIKEYSIDDIQPNEGPNPSGLLGPVKIETRID
jgi:hypothetical protein